MLRGNRLVMLVGLLVLLPAISFSSVINVPTDQSTIQAGIKLAVNGEIVQIDPESFKLNIFQTMSHNPRD